VSGFTAMPDGAWAYVYDAVRAAYAGREWPEELAVLQLRWMMGERRMGRMKASAWPTVRKLQEEWGWLTKSGKPATDRVATFLSRTRDVSIDGRVVTILHWQDEHRHASLEELRGDRLVGANRIGPDENPTGSRREPDGNPTHGTGEPDESTPVPAGKPTGTRREPDAARVSSARVHTSTVPPPGGGVPARAVDTTPLEPECPDAGDAPNRGTVTPRAASATPALSPEVPGSSPGAWSPAPPRDAATPSAPPETRRPATTAPPPGDGSDEPVVLRDGRELPGNLPALLWPGPGSPEGCHRVGRVDVIDRLLRVPICSTRELLAVPLDRWRDDRGKCFLPGMAGLVDRLEVHLRARWGVELGELAAPSAPARGPPSRASPRSDPMATLGACAEIAFADP